MNLFKNMKVPRYPEDAKSLYLSIIGGLIVSIIIISRDVMDIIFKTENRDFTLIALFIILFVLFLLFLEKYSFVRSHLDKKLNKSGKKKK
jgi:hypothetical protein